MTKLGVTLAAVLLFIVIITRTLNAQLIGNIISTHTNQPCASIDQSLNGTGTFICSEATVLQLGLTPQFSNVSSSTTFFFRSIPNDVGPYQQDFYLNNNDPANTFGSEDVCSDINSASCVTALNANLLQVQITVSSVPIGYNLVNTGIVVPIAYYYQTLPYGLNTGFQSDACSIDPYSNVNDQHQTMTAYAKAANMMSVDKYHITGYPDSCTTEDIYARYLLSSYAMSVPGDNSPYQSWTSACQSNTTQCPFTQATMRANGYERPTQQGFTFDILDVIYNRWLNGTLGTGQAITLTPGITQRIYGTQGGGTDQDIAKSYKQCTTPIQPPGSPNTYTVPVCPGNPLPSFKNRNDNVYPSYCVSGNCQGAGEAFCALVAGFEYAFSRCLMSKSASLNYLRTATNECFNHLSLLLNPQPFDPTNDYQRQWFLCVEALYTNNANFNISSNFSSATDDIICSRYLQQISMELGDDDKHACGYPFMVNRPNCGTVGSAPPCSGVGCQTVPPPVDGSGQFNLQWASYPYSDEVRQKCVPFQPYDIPKKNITLYQAIGFCGAEALDPLVDHKGYDAVVSNSPCPCGCNVGWQDTVVPVGPLCTVYAIENPGLPLYTIDITVINATNNNCTMKIGSVAGPDGTPVLSSTCGNLISATVFDVGKPRGSVAPSLEGFIVVCGEIQDDDVNNVAAGGLYGGGDKTGQTNPFKRLTQQNFRMPIPSTMKEMFHDNCTKDAQGSCAWWYYVPIQEVHQFGEECTDNGWMNYGFYSTSSTMEMCANRPGTCVPGYDTRNYNAKRYNSSLPSDDGYPYKWPTTKTPLFVARTFVDYEIAGTDNDLPFNVPLGWNPALGNYWIDGNTLYSDASPTGGPIFTEGDIIFKVNLAIAGELVAVGTSFSSGSLLYPYGTDQSDPNNLVPEAPIIYPTTPPTTNQPPSACYVSVNAGGGSLSTVVWNTGSLTGSYTLAGNCTNDASIETESDFSVNSGDQVLVNLKLDYIATSWNLVTCQVYLFAAFTAAVLDSIPYTCVLVNNSYDGPGSIVVGTEQVNTDPYLHAPKNPSQGSNIGQWFKNAGLYLYHHLGGLLSGIFYAIFIFFLIAIIAVTIIRMKNKVNEITVTARITSLKEKEELNTQMKQLDKEEEINKSLTGEEPKHVPREEIDS